MSYLLKKAIATGSITNEAITFLEDRGAILYPIDDGPTILIRLPDCAHMQKDILGSWLILFSNEQGNMEYGFLEVMNHSINVYQTKVVLRQYNKACALCEARETHSYAQHEQSRALA